MYTNLYTFVELMFEKLKIIIIRTITIIIKLKNIIRALEREEKLPETI